MANPLYKQLNGGGADPRLQQLRAFMNGFSGDPKQMVQNMINSGRISQDQVNRYAQQANELYKILK